MDRRIAPPVTLPDADPRAPAPFHAAPIQCGLQDRVIGGLVDLQAPSWWVVLLDSGSAVLTTATGSLQVEAPALLWLPWNRADRVRARAGTVGGQLVLGDAMLANAIGAKPEAADLRVLAARSLALPLADRPMLRHDVGRCFDIILREAAEAAPGSDTVIEAQVRVLLVLAWRHTARPDPAQVAPPAGARILQEFRQSVETHFRDRWTVADHARALRVSPDRLHDLCRRMLQRTPLRLIHERQAHEAQLLLERSSMTVDQIAHFLGFRSASHFSAFFRALTGLPPGTYRRQTRARAAGGDGSAPSFADWP